MPDPEPDDPSPSRAVDLVSKLSHKGFWTSTKGILGAAAAAAAVLTFLLRFWPSSEAACDANSASLSNPQVHTGTLESFLERTSTASDPTAGYDRDRLDDPVRWASVAVSVVGHKGKFLTVRWSMVHARTDQSGNLPDNRAAVEFKPPGCKRTAFREEVLLPPIPPGRPVYVTFDLVDESNERLPPEEVRTAVIRTTSE